MATNIQIDADKFFINGKLTYPGVSYRGQKIEGLLFNSRMVQAVFDDSNPVTTMEWRYPDTGIWDADRNVNDFCAALPEYRRHGLLAVTVGLQGGGSIYRPEIYDQYINSAYEPDGTFKPAYFNRMKKIIQAADQAGMVVIVNYFYVKQARRLENEQVARKITEGVTDWLLRTGHHNLLVDVANESASWWQVPHFQPENIHKLIEIVQHTTLDDRRLLVGCSTSGGAALPSERWQAVEDFHMPHGNGLKPEGLQLKLQQLKNTQTYQRHPKPILVNEDSVFVENLEAAIEVYASWGFYHQGYGSQYKDLSDWTVRGREEQYEELSGFQTVPVNWGINDPWKKVFFGKLKEITQT